jgi:hypothetical protein
MNCVIFVATALLSSAILTRICYRLALDLGTLWLRYFCLGGALAGLCTALILMMVAPGFPEQPHGIMTYMALGSHNVSVGLGWILGHNRLARPKQAKMTRSHDRRRGGVWDQQLDGYDPDPSAKVR